MKKLLILLSLFFVFALTPSVFAQTTDTTLPSPGLLPDSPIYFLKPLSEKVRGLFIFGEDSKALYALTLVDKRLSEAKALSDKGKDNLAGQTAEQAGKENENAQEHLAKAKSEGKNITAVVERLVTNSGRQQAVLTKVLEKVPEQAKAAIQRAMEVSKRDLIKAQEMQPKEKGEPENTGKPEGIGIPNGTPEKPNGVGKPANLQGGPGKNGQGPGGQGQGGGKGSEGQGGPQGPGDQSGPDKSGQGPGGPGQGGLGGGGKGPGGQGGQGPGGGKQGQGGPGSPGQGGPGGGAQGPGNQGGGNGGGGKGPGGQGGNGGGGGQGNGGSGGGGNGGQGGFGGGGQDQGGQ